MEERLTMMNENLSYPFQVIKPNEFVILAKVMHEDEDDLEEILEDINLIDRMLIFQQSRTLLMKRSPKLHQQLDALIHCRVTGQQAHWDSRKREFNFSKPNNTENQ